MSTAVLTRRDAVRLLLKYEAAVKQDHRRARGGRLVGRPLPQARSDERTAARAAVVAFAGERRILALTTAIWDKQTAKFVTSDRFAAREAGDALAQARSRIVQEVLRGLPRELPHEMPSANGLAPSVWRPKPLLERTRALLVERQNDGGPHFGETVYHVDLALKEYAKAEERFLATVQAELEAVDRTAEIAKMRAEAVGNYVGVVAREHATYQGGGVPSQGNIRAARRDVAMAVNRIETPNSAAEDIDTLTKLVRVREDRAAAKLPFDVTQKHIDEITQKLIAWK